MKLFIDPDDMKAQYEKSPAWLKALMNAWADGLNYYLAHAPEGEAARHHAVRAVDGADLQRGQHRRRHRAREPRRSSRRSTASKPAATEPRRRGADAGYAEPTGSNGIADRARRTPRPARALLLINPHTSFFFRAEAQMVSDEGLNAYGALTWGQFFVYQGFNERAGWMHTSSGVDNIDEYLETVVKKGDRLLLPRTAPRSGRSRSRTITVPYKTATGMAQKDVHRLPHAPRPDRPRRLDGKWVSVRLMQEPLKALTQSYSRTKARIYEAFRESMELHTNSSNNTIYADADGNIAYFHANFIPRRDPQVRLDEAGGRQRSGHRVEGRARRSTRRPILLNPASGWLYNTQQLAVVRGRARAARRRRTYPAYVDRGQREPARHPRDPRARRTGRTSPSTRCSPPPTTATCRRSRSRCRALVKAWDELPPDDPLKAKLAEPIALLRAWDFRWGGDVGADLAGGLLGRGGRAARRRRGPEGGRPGRRVHRHAAPRRAAAARRSRAAVDRLTADFGTWKTPWGEINRFQRLTGDIVQKFNDAGAEHPGRLHVGALGLARLVRRAHLPGHEEDVRHQRQQLRGGRRVRAPRARESRQRGRPERRPLVAALQRPGHALRNRRPARGVLLSRTAQGPRRARISAGEVVASGWWQAARG